MLVARILYPVVALGPGKRIGIWVCGCHRRCEHCANPELQAFDPARTISVEMLTAVLLDFIKKYPVDGITITGGEPFEQAEELASLLRGIVDDVPDILVFSGYTHAQLKARQDSATDGLLKIINVLIDGEYIDSQNNGSVLRGSDNQQIHFLQEIHRDQYAAYLTEGRKFQNFETEEGIIAVGLHYRGFLDEIQQKLNQKLSEG